jgi:hypothetical protein
VKKKARKRKSPKSKEKTTVIREDPEGQPVLREPTINQ